ncbi:hypothetical protein ANN_26946 [Periplaneta americana]|uniref:Major facilitator superfamily (MFS) profile domain-containing protein n=1 Tax=Periplaneta americana TaxID=6978 RepID=A0ABQ8RWY5_PERAM|nr:hypothetical protein ANN_26946 [Periplaneta americana]
MRETAMSTAVGETPTTTWKSKMMQVVAACVVNLASIAYGMAMSWPTPSLPHLAAGDLLLDCNIITEDEGAWLGSLVYLGALISSPIFSYVSQTYGRKIAGYTTVIPLIISWLPIVFSESLYLFYASRFLMGMASGGVLTFCPMYVGEIAEDSIRGTLGTVRSTCGNIAFVFMCIVGAVISIRDMAILCLTMPIIFALAFYWLPESPLFLMRRGRTLEAMAALIWVRGGDVKAAGLEMMKLTAVVKESSSRNVSLKTLFSSKGTRRALTICIVLGLCQQLSGISAVLNYAVSIFELAGSSISPNTATTIVACVQLLGSLTSSIFMDLAGRRILILFSQISMTSCLGGLGIYFYMQQEGYDMTSVGFLPLMCMGLYVLTLSVGVGSVTYIIMAELFTPEARGLATTAITMVVWLTAFLSTKFYPNLVHLLGLPGCYWLFASICVVCAVFTIFKIPETKNRSLESILRELNGDDIKSDSESGVKTIENSSAPERY